MAKTRSATHSAYLPALLRRLWQHFPRRRRRQMVVLAVLVLLSGFAEIVSLGAVLPFLGILTSPARMMAHAGVVRFMHSWGIAAPDRLVLPFAAAFSLAAVMAGAFRLLVLWTNTRISYAVGADLSLEVYRRTLYQPYRVHVASNSSEVISGITGKIGDTIYVLTSLLTLSSSIIVMTFITATLLAIDSVVASIAIAGFGACYVLLTAVTRHRLHRAGQRITYEHTQVIKALQEGLGGIRDVLLDGTQPVFARIYQKADRSLRSALGDVAFIGASPRFVMEAVGMVLIAALAYGVSRRAGGVAGALPTLGALALGAQRILPLLQQAYGSWANIVAGQASVSAVLEMLDRPIAPELLGAAPKPLEFSRDIRFSHVRFRYTPDGPWILDDFDLMIPKGARFGLVGDTGAGKSTALDLLMGLLAPTEGELLVDGEPVAGARIRAWQNAIAHVPQSIFLADASLAENIAFGVPRNAIDMDRVKRAARRAQIAEFIESRRDGYEGRVGERGIRLSGGQRQRIGIARALYKQARVLVFDEATSALDHATERAVMDGIESLDRDLTILLIAHRLSTVRRCDCIVEIGEGRVLAQGSYEKLFASSPSFQRRVSTIA